VKTFILSANLFLVYKNINATLNYMKTFISINQLNPISNQPSLNFATAQKTIAQNAAEGSRLAIFPEDFLYGILRDRKDLMNAGQQFEVWVKKFCDLAKKYQIAIIPGTFPCLKDGSIYNSTVYIDEQGNVKTKYSKNNLWLSERDDYRPSLQFPEVFKGVLGRMTIIICWDILDHNLFEYAVKHGAEWVVVLAFWSTNQSKDLAIKRGVPRSKRSHNISSSKMIDYLVLSRVAEYNVGIIFSNFAGIHEYAGVNGPQRAISANRSQLISPYGAVQVALRNRKEASLFCKLGDTKQDMKDFETHYGRREDIMNSYPWSS
jgi:predicted amidohydrolase